MVRLSLFTQTNRILSLSLTPPPHHTTRISSNLCRAPATQSWVTGLST